MSPVRASQAVALYEAGKTLSEAGAVLGCSGAYIRRLLVRQGVDRRQQGPLRKPMFEIVLMRLMGLRLEDIGAVLHLKKAAVCLRLARINALGDLSPLAALNSVQMAAYREALDVDRLPHPDALEVALEYEAQEAA